MLTRFICFLSLLLPYFLTAQSNYKEAAVVTGTGDTMHGFINYKEWFRNPDKVLFKQRLEDENVQYLTPENTAWYAVLGYESYASYTVAISRNELRFDQLQDVVDTTTITKAVFLKELVKGDRLNLYTYKDDIKERYYIFDKRHTTPRELIYRKTVTGMEEHMDVLYRQQLLQVATEFDRLNADLDLRIQTAAYTRDDLKKIISRVNTTAEPVLTQSLDKKRKTAFFISIGINKNRVIHSGESLVTIDRIDNMGRNKYKERISTEAYVPRFAAGMDYFVNPAVRRFVIRTELAATSLKSAVQSYYKYNNYSDDELEYTYRLSALMVSFTPQVLYNVYNTANLKWYAGAGVPFSYIHARENSLHRKEINQNSNGEETTENYFLLRKYTLNTVLQSGVLIKQRVSFSIMWGNPVDYTNYAGGTTASIKSNLLAFSAAFVL